MRQFRDLPIRRKLVIVGMVTSASALLLTTAIFVISAYFIVRRNTRTGLEIQASIFANAMPAAVARRDTAVTAEMLRPLQATPTIDLACVYTMEPALLARLVAAPQQFSCPSAPPADQGSATGGRVVVVRPIVFDGQRVGTLYLHGNLARLAEQLRLEAIAAVCGAIIGLLMAALIAARLQRQIADPILSLSQTSARISRAADYTLRAEKQGDDEVGALVDTFNAMVAAIEQRDGELRDVNRLKDEFLAALSHELRTPLSAIVGWLQILKANRNDPAVVEQAIQRLERNAHAQGRLIEDLLDVSRIVTGKLELKLGQVDLVGVVESAIDVIRPSVEAKAITLGADLSAGPCFVSGDTDRLQQVVSNLLSNALKFTERGGRVDVCLVASGSAYTVAVSDNGSGIAPEFLPKVFDRFRQADGSVTRHHGGLGLGLAIARDLVELHGGRIEAMSDGPGKGSVFTLVLPQLPMTSEAGVHETAPAFAARLDGLSVLVADDDPDARMVARQALTGAGAQVEVASSGSEAVAALESREFDVLVCDIAMPDLDGYSVLKRIRGAQSRTGEAVAAVATTAHAGADARRRAFEAGFHGFVPKPYQFAALSLSVAQAAESRLLQRERQDSVPARAGRM